MIYPYTLWNLGNGDDNNNDNDAIEYNGAFVVIISTKALGIIMDTNVSPIKNALLHIHNIGVFYFNASML